MTSEPLYTAIGMLRQKECLIIVAYLNGLIYILKHFNYVLNAFLWSLLFSFI